MNYLQNRPNINKYKNQIFIAIALFFVGVIAATLIVKSVPVYHESNNVLMRSVDNGIKSGGGKCQKDRDCGTGTCTFVGNQTSGTCECDADNRFTGANCDYERKSQLVAFLLSFFLGSYGVDRFYLGYIGVGVAKLLIGLGICVSPCFCCCCENAGRVGGGIWAGLVGLAIFIWWIVDWVFIIQGKLPDFNGVALLQNL